MMRTLLPVTLLAFLAGCMTPAATEKISNPIIYELSTRAFLHELSVKYKTPVSLSTSNGMDIVKKELLSIKQNFNVDYFWLMGVWKLGEYSLNIARQTDFSKVLYGYTKDDIIGSPYAIVNYTCNPSIGSDSDLLNLKTFLNANGVKLMLDFIPNHVAVDHPWACSNPDYLMPVDQADFGSQPCLNGDSVIPPCQKNQGTNRKFYYGGDYWNLGWTDTLQLNYYNPKLRAAQIKNLQYISTFSDGVRCDMSMSILIKHMQLTWVKDDRDGKQCSTGKLGRMASQYANNPPQTEFWTDAIRTIKQSNPDFLFMAESYNYGFTDPFAEDVYLRQLGFDYTYDIPALKLLMPTTRSRDWFDRYVRGQGRRFFERAVHFVENHDDNRAAGAMFDNRSWAARAGAAAVSTLPGARLFYHGQFECNPNVLSVHLRRGNDFQPVPYCVQWYKDLLAVLSDDISKKGKWVGPETGFYIKDANSYNYPYSANTDTILWKWRYQCKERLIVVNYHQEETSGMIIIDNNFSNPNQEVVVQERLMDKNTYRHTAIQLKDAGMWVRINGWDTQIFDYNIC